MHSDGFPKTGGLLTQAGLYILSPEMHAWESGYAFLVTLEIPAVRSASFECMLYSPPSRYIPFYRRRPAEKGWWGFCK